MRPNARCALATVLAVLMTGACARAGEPCDDATLESTAASIEAERRAWSADSGRPPPRWGERAAIAVWHACPGLPEPLRWYVDFEVDHHGSGHDEERLESLLPGHEDLHGPGSLAKSVPGAEETRLAVCPDGPTLDAGYGERRSGQLYDGCDLGRFELLSRDEFVALRLSPFELRGAALRDYLRGHGVEVGVARSLARKIMLEDAFADAPRVPSTLRLPSARSVPVRSEGAGTVLVDIDGKWANDRHHVFVDALGYGRAELPRDQLPLRLVADRDVPWSKLEPLIGHAALVGVQSISVAVLVDDDVVPLRAVTLHAGSSVVPAWISIGHDSVTLACGGHVLALPEDPTQWVLDSCGSEPHLQLVATPSVELQRIVEVLEVLPATVHVAAGAIGTD